MASSNYAVNGLRRAVAQNFVDGFVEAMHEAGVRGSKQFKALGEALSVEAVPPSLRTRVHADVGKAAQQATVHAYRSRPNRSRAGSYRVGDRYAGGALERALRSPDFYRATPKGLGIINTSRLNQEARHWRRLNFGAGAAGGAGPRSFPIDLLQASVGLEPDRRPGFVLPPGFWMRNGERVAPGKPGTAQFFPRGIRGSGARGRANAARFTRGIRATNFLDAGVKEVADKIMPSYLTMYREFYNSKVGKTHFQRINVVAPRPRTFRV